MALSLSWSDNQDATGGVATVAGTGGAAVTVYAQRADATGFSAASFNAAGSRTGDGAVPLTLGTGYYWLYAGTGGAPSNFLYAPATDNAVAVHERCLRAVLARVKGLCPLAGTADSPASLPAGNVYDQLLPNDKLVKLPAVLITLEGEREQYRPTVNARDDLGYPLRVQVCDRNDGDYVRPRAKYLRWRQTLMRGLRYQRLAGVPEVYTCTPEPGLVVDPHLPSYQYFVSGFVLRCWSREVRG
jgi:hypothetical protein